MPSSGSANPVDPPLKVPPVQQWEHYGVWHRVNDLIYSLPNYFEAELVIRGINVTEVFSMGSAFATVIETQVVNILNKLRGIWDPENAYSKYAFIRQSQTFPDVLLRNLETPDDILFGIELKSWYVLSKEGEPSFRYKVDPDACATADLIVVVPWILSDVLSGTPGLLTPYKELAKYAAEYRNYYWQKSRMENNENPEINRPPEQNRKPYPSGKQECSDEAASDRGGNFGRIARAGILDDYTSNIKAQDYLGIKITHWITFFKAISETSTDSKIDKRLQTLKNQILSEPDSPDEETSRHREVFLEVIGRLEELWEKIP